jgi:hypothetical protein
MRSSYATVLALAVCAGMGNAETLVPFVIPAQTHSESALALRSFSPIQIHDERLVVHANHFYRGDQRVRVWGVNLSFGANFPSHQAASEIAARLAAAGINSVRCHHMDTAQWPRGIWDAQDREKISIEALDRLDYFIDQLARHGIYVNINLHVGRAHSEVLGLPATKRNYDKVTCLFAPALIRAQRDYARTLLTHVNPYRQRAYAHDPAIAFVEITNENSFFMWDGEQALRSLPPHYARMLQAQYNTWLKDRYQKQDALVRTWAEGTMPLGDNLIRNGLFRSKNAGEAVPSNWNMEQHDACRARIVARPSSESRGIRIQITQHDEADWHLQFKQGGHTLKAGQYYTVSFDARSDVPRSIGCNVGQAHEPWSNLGLSRTISLNRRWTRSRLGFVAKADDNNARLSFTFGNDNAAFMLDKVELRRGGQVGLDPCESLPQGTITLFRDNESHARALDRLEFLAQTEKAYFDQMHGYIKQDLGCKALVAGTIVFGPLGLYAQSDMDFIDAHAYWQHPSFPGRPWDAGNWLIKQKPMVDYPQEATLFALAAKRLKGKPFTVSEYNHPAPMDSQAACVPMLASFGAAQDWDGIWLYTYSHSSDDWDRQHLYSYFDIDTNPAKWGFIRSGTGIFRAEGLGRLSHVVSIPLAEKGGRLLSRLAEHHDRHGRNMFAALASVYSMGHSNLLQAQLSCALQGNVTVQPRAETSPQLSWFVEEGKGLYAAAGRNAVVVVGHAQHFDLGTRGRIKLDAPGFVSLTLTALDDKALEASDRILITACGRCQNTGMVFGEDRQTVGRQWGRAPVLIEPVTGTVGLSDAQWQGWSLSPDGTRKQRISTVTQQGHTQLVMTAAHKTMWYLVERTKARE